MENDSGRTWTTGAIANGHILSEGSGWVRLNLHANRGGPWRAGDVVNEHAFTGTRWVALPPGWRPDPTGRHHLRWYTGHLWSDHAMTAGLRYQDPLAPMPRSAPMPPAAWAATPSPYKNVPARTGPGFWGVVDKLALGGYSAFWLCVAIYSASIAVRDKDTSYLALTATASMNTFLFMLTGKTRAELRKAVIAKLPYILCGAVAAGGVWLSLHFDDPTVLYVTMFFVGTGLLFAWALTS